MRKRCFSTVFGKKANTERRRISTVIQSNNQYPSCPVPEETVADTKYWFLVY